MRTDLAFGPSLRFGVLGGGQLGRMMIQSAIDWDLRVEVMDPDPDDRLAGANRAKEKQVRCR